MSEKEKEELFKSRVRAMGEAGAKHTLEQLGAGPHSKKALVLQVIKEFEDERLSREHDLNDKQIGLAREANHLARGANLEAFHANKLANKANLIAWIAIVIAIIAAITSLFK